MPPKRIALSRSTFLARKKRTNCVSEKSEQREERLETNREHNALARSLETSDKQERRLLANQLRTYQARSSETSEQRDARIKINQGRTSLFRRCQYSDLNLSAFHYDPTTNYSLSPKRHHRKNGSIMYVL
ncbi:zinc finger protein 821-like [Parasteatoda tepidariorum]|uniref:zinc finger protein 821-like n=1 Tax=Parasteatoda tepidariorum TaxID=114398 RepID=UPI0039BCBA3C